jgi:putative transposase
MPWKVCKAMDERLKFIARLLDGEQMAPLCREFGISRKTGYKILTRYNATGLEGLTDRSRRPYRHANQLPIQIETLIVRVKQDKPSWGAPKIRERLARLYPDVHTPAISTVHAVLDRHGLVKRRTKRRNRAQGTTLSRPAQPNELSDPTRRSTCSVPHSAISPRHGHTAACRISTIRFTTRQPPSRPAAASASTKRSI